MDEINTVEFEGRGFFESICSKTGKSKVTATLTQDTLGHKVWETLEFIIDDGETTDVEDYFITVWWEEQTNYIKVANETECNFMTINKESATPVETN